MPNNQNWTNTGASLTLALAVALSINSQTAPSGPFTLDWDEPLVYTDGSNIGAGEIGGYRIYKWDEQIQSAQLYSQTYNSSETTHTCEEGEYFVVPYDNQGKNLCELSTAVETTHWYQKLIQDFPPTAGNTIDASITQDKATINASIAAMNRDTDPVRYIRGTFNYNDDVASDGYFTVPNTIAGTPTNPVYIVSHPDEKAVLVGNFLSTHNLDDTISGTQQRLLQVNTQYTRFYNIEFKESSRYGVHVQAGNFFMEECTSHDNLETSFLVDKDVLGLGQVNNGEFRYCLAYGSRNKPAFWFGYSSPSDTHFVDNWTLFRCISFNNGFKADGSPVDVGGDADNFGVFKGFHDAYEQGHADGVADGRWNKMHNFRMFGCLSWRGYDDSVDVVPGLGTIVNDGFASTSGPGANRGYKNFSLLFETNTYISLTSFRMNPYGGALASKTLSGENEFIPYLRVEDTDTSLRALEITLTGSFVATITLQDSSDKVVWNDVAGETYIAPGTYNFNDNLPGGQIVYYRLIIKSGEYTSGSLTADLLNIRGSAWGYELNTNVTAGTFPTPRVNMINCSGYHNTDSNSSNSSLRARSTDGFGRNNVAGYGPGGVHTTFDGTWDQQNFHSTDTAPNVGIEPQILNPAFDFVSDTLNGQTIKEIWYNKYWEVLTNFMPVKDGNIYGVGEKTIFHTSVSADNISNPPRPDDPDKSIWLKYEKAGDFPDLGGVQFRKVQPLFLRVT